jgi:hypothetical protein
MAARRGSLLTPAGRYDRAAIMRSKAWRDFRSVQVAGDRGMTFTDWLRNAWRVARAQRAQRSLIALA